MTFVARIPDGGLASGMIGSRIKHLDYHRKPYLFIGSDNLYLSEPIIIFAFRALFASLLLIL